MAEAVDTQILHDPGPKYLLLSELWESSIMRPCGTFSSNSGDRGGFCSLEVSDFDGVWRVGFTFQIGVWGLGV